VRVIPSRRTDPETSHLGEQDVKMRATSQKFMLLTAYSTHGQMNSEHAAQMAGLSPLSCYWKRCSELCLDMGYLEDTGKTEMGRAGSARIVYRITPRGEAALRRVKN
jgi:hypothetical protein